MTNKVKLPPISDSDILNYIDCTFRAKKEHSKMLGSNAFRNWQDYLNNERRTNQLIKESDVARFISILEHDRNRSLRTISSYLGQLANFFYFEKMNKVADFTRIQGNTLIKKAKEEQKYKPILSKHLQAIYGEASLKGRVLIRLLLFEKNMPIGDIARVHTSKNGDQYGLFLGKTELDLKDNEVLVLIKQMVESNRLEVDKQFFAGPRGLNDYIRRLTQSTLGYRITAMNLKKFGSYVHKQDIDYWLTNALKKT